MSSEDLLDIVKTFGSVALVVVVATAIALPSSPSSRSRWPLWGDE